MKMTIPVFLMILCIVTNSYGYARLPISRTNDVKGKHLKLINKPPITSIKTKFGDIIDCVDINKQPAFNHPLLKNHKLQRKPSFLSRRIRTNEHNALPIGTVEFELEKDSCPIGSVPIRRTTKDDPIRMKSVFNQTHGLTQGAPGSHFASLYTKQGDNYSYFGVHGSVNVYNPRVKEGQMSLAQLGVENGELGRTNAILSGWQVSPRLYGSRRHTHLFALWTSDSFKKTGCYNMNCPGFVQTDRNIFLGSRVSNISSYGGQQFELSFSISQDPKSFNWWLIVQNISVGYFPTELFSNLSMAGLVGWGGRVYGAVGNTSPQMGSGYFPDGDFSHASFIRRIQYDNKPASVVDAQKDRLQIYVDNPGCYRLLDLGYLNEENGYAFQFGGPGGDCGI